MRTTIRLDGALLREAKARAARGGRSLNEFIEEAVRAAVLRPGATNTARTIPVFDGGALRPGVSLDHGAELLAMMDEGDRIR